MTGGIGVIAIGTILGTVLSAQCGTTTRSSANAVRNNRILETATPEPTGSPASTASATATASPAPTASPVARQFSAPPEMTIDQAKSYTATIKTERGDIKLDLFPKDAPQAVNNFVFLARNGFYDGLTFHRVLEGFVAQGGDPKGDGTGGPGYFLPQERNSLKHEAGSIAMARSAQGISGSQFYITYTPQPSLDQQGFTVFGKVSSGLDVLQNLTKRDPSRNPRAAPGDKILGITIDER